MCRANCIDPSEDSELRRLLNIVIIDACSILKTASKTERGYRFLLRALPGYCVNLPEEYTLHSSPSNPPKKIHRQDILTQCAAAQQAKYY